jgi:hypothetical protein
LEVVVVVVVVVDKRKMREEPAAAAAAAHGKRKRPRAAGRFGTTRRRACQLGAIQVRGEAHRAAGVADGFAPICCAFKGVASDLSRTPTPRKRARGRIFNDCTTRRGLRSDRLAFQASQMDPGSRSVRPVGVGGTLTYSRVTMQYLTSEGAIYVYLHTV